MKEKYTWSMLIVHCKKNCQHGIYGKQAMNYTIKGW
jgi:hypothetical protein